MMDTTRKETSLTDSSSNKATAFDDYRVPGINEHIGGLRIIEPIASGGMATVYKVRHEGLEVTRAIKILKPGCTQECRDRLLTEAKISANLHHPNIVQIFNVALWNGSIPYIEMEYVSGSALREVLADRQRIPFIVAAAIGSVICRALDFAGQQTFTVYGKEYHGLVHRDIKPANILLSSSGVVKLADFGIALPGSESLHTSGSVIMGTVPYLSPEQLNGERLDQRSDIYSLGTVLYEMISGEKAYRQKSMGEIVKVKLDGSYNPAHTLRPDVPEPFAEIIEQSMEPDKAQRFRSADEFGKALDEAIAKISDQPPAEIVKEYVRNKGTISMKTSPHLWKRGSNTSFLLWWLGGFAALIVLMGTALWILDGPGLPVKREIVVPAPPETLPARVDTVVIAGPVPAPQPHAVALNRNLLVDEEPKPIRQPSPAEQGLLAFDAGKLNQAIALLEKASEMDLPPTQYSKVRMRLLDAYLRIGNLEGARQLASQRIEDGYFYLLSGKMYLEFDDPSEALKNLEAAARIPSILEKRDEEISYFLAKACDAQYRKKPNAENRIRALEVWSRYVDAQCGASESGNRCEEAQRRKTELSR